MQLFWYGILMRLWVTSRRWSLPKAAGTRRRPSAPQTGWAVVPWTVDHTAAERPWTASLAEGAQHHTLVCPYKRGSATPLLALRGEVLCYFG